MMESRVSLITLGVADLDRAADFYQNVIGWPVAARPGDVVFFDLNGLILALFGHAALGQDMNVAAVLPVTPYRGMTLAHNVDSREAVDAVFARLATAGIVPLKAPEPVFWGGYSGYFADPDGHVWEIAHNPFWTILEDGRISMQSPD